MSALDELHDKRASVVQFLYAVNLRDMRVIERCQHSGFPLETHQPVVVEREAFRQDLQGDVARKSRVASAVHLAHAAGSDQGDNLVGTDGVASREMHERDGVDGL